MYDLIIIGGGPAAIAAGIYAARKKVKTLFLVKEWGGQAMKTGSIENYPGFEKIRGPELVEKLVSHLRKYQPANSVIPAKAGIQSESEIIDSRFRGNDNVFEIKEGIEVKKIEWISNEEIKIDDFQAKALIIATGGIPRKLNVPGEKEFSGKGVAYCSICDAPLFKNEEVAIVGGGNAGLESALDLAKYAKKIYLLEFKEQLSGDKFLSDQIQRDEKITIMTNVAVKEIKGDKFVTGLVYQDNQSKETKELSIQGVFVSIGWTANSSLLKNVVELNQRGEVAIDCNNQTSKSNIFAAGDVTDVSYKQLIIAAGEGAKAALNAYEYIIKK